jgi:hypothetical protein
MNTTIKSNDTTPATTQDRPRIKTSTRPPAREAMPWYTCVTVVL